MTVWIRLKADEGSSLHAAAQIVRERGYVAIADDLDVLAERWGRGQLRRFRIWCWLTPWKGKA